jgi:hypothetical protein
MKRLPRARKEGLLIQELPGELLVYDLERHKAHCLNAAAAEVWKQCDGRTLVSEVMAASRKKLGADKGEAAVWYSLEQLQKARLLAEPVAIPETAAGVSRRRMLRRIGVTAALGLPLVTTMVAPRAVDASSCLPSGSDCGSSAQCCSGICIGGTCA